MKAAIWSRVSTREQETQNQLEVLRGWAKARGFEVVREYVLEESAWNGKHQAKLDEALVDAHRGEYQVLLVWALDRLSRQGIEALLSLMRRFRDKGVQVLSHQEPWTDQPPQMQELLSALFAWIAEQESSRKSERIKAALALRKSRGLPVGRQPGAKDKRKRKRSGYIARWENEREATA
jgi:DNA invertase Pin-like site-specific DNA recombinase